MATLFRVSGATNGYSISLDAPIKLSKSDSNWCYNGESEILCKDDTDLLKSIKALLPLLEKEYTDKDAFESAFKEATKTA